MPPDKIKSLWLAFFFVSFCVSSFAVNAERECTAERNVHTSHCFREEEEEKNALNNLAFSMCSKAPKIPNIYRTENMYAHTQTRAHSFPTQLIYVVAVTVVFVIREKLKFNQTQGKKRVKAKKHTHN